MGHAQVREEEEEDEEEEEEEGSKQLSKDEVDAVEIFPLAFTGT